MKYLVIFIFLLNFLCTLATPDELMQRSSFRYFDEQTQERLDGISVHVTELSQLFANQALSSKNNCPKKSDLFSYFSEFCPHYLDLKNKKIRSQGQVRVQDELLEEYKNLTDFGDKVSQECLADMRKIDDNKINLHRLIAHAPYQNFDTLMGILRILNQNVAIKKNKTRSIRCVAGKLYVFNDDAQGLHEKVLGGYLKRFSAKSVFPNLRYDKMNRAHCVGPILINRKKLIKKLEKDILLEINESPGLLSGYQIETRKLEEKWHIYSNHRIEEMAPALCIKARTHQCACLYANYKNKLNEKLEELKQDYLQEIYDDVYQSTVDTLMKSNLSASTKRRMKRKMLKNKPSLEVYESSGGLQAQKRIKENTIRMSSTFLDQLVSGGSDHLVKMVLAHEVGHHFSAYLADTQECDLSVLDDSRGFCNKHFGYNKMKKKDHEKLAGLRECIDKNILKQEIPRSVVFEGVELNQALTASAFRQKRDEYFGDLFAAEYLKTQSIQSTEMGQSLGKIMCEYYEDAFGSHPYFPYRAEWMMSLIYGSSTKGIPIEEKYLCRDVLFEN